MNADWIQLVSDRIQQSKYSTRIILYCFFRQVIKKKTIKPLGMRSNCIKCFLAFGNLMNRVRVYYELIT